MRRYFYVDFEMFMTTAVSLRRMSLLDYLAQSYVTAAAWAWDNDPVQVVCGELGHKGSFGPAEEQVGWFDFMQQAHDAVADPDTVVVAHNAAFDVRIMVEKLALPWPENIHCTLELACAVWPNQAGGHSLADLSETLSLANRKRKIDLMDCTEDELHAYVAADVEACRELHQRALAILSPREVAVAEFTNRQREMHLDMDPDKVASAIAVFQQASSDSVLSALIAMLGKEGDTEREWTIADLRREHPDIANAFGWDGDRPRSVKPHAVKALLEDRFGWRTTTISQKKINPATYARPGGVEAHAVVTASGRANKTMFHSRRATVLVGQTRTPVELGYFRAATGRFSSPAVGRAGANLHNFGKRDKLVAKATRSIYSLPPGYCFVRVDASNAEYRLEALWTGCRYATKLFDADPMANPYVAFWREATGKQITKKGNPVEYTLAKAAVLGLGFAMGYARWMQELMIVVSDPASGVTLDALTALSRERGWRLPSADWALDHWRRVNVPECIAVVAWNTREAFHKLHPEFFETGEWLQEMVTDVSRSANLSRTLDRHRKQIPVPELLDILPAPHLSGRSVWLRCGLWEPTLAWRDLSMRTIGKDTGLACMHARHGWRFWSKNVGLENITQAMSRNAIVLAQEKLKDRWPYQLTVHDELLLVAPRDRDSVLQARDDLLRVCGPGNKLGYGWGFQIAPDEISVSRTLYEDQQSAQWWADLEAGNEQLLEALP